MYCVAGGVMGTVRFDPPSKDAWGHLHLGCEAICPFGEVTVKVRGQEEATVTYSEYME